jgi:hypothetical protein
MIGIADPKLWNLVFKKGPSPKVVRFIMKKTTET